jgi:hypothetical protein
MENAKQQLVDRIKSANNVLVTVSRNPSVDALSALLGLTLVLNKQGKHAAAVFSGQVPSTIEFLQPEETIEKNTDSLRDFIIALDKNKADKLRYKVEDNVVRIFITPYKTSISKEDFEFSEGDFNIDVVVALGVAQQEDLDEAITTHGRILHDATVASITVAPDAGLGSINWHEPQASSLSELVTDLTQMLGPDLLDEQIATALLTGIVAETDRFSNDKTTSITMSMSAALMKAGANQQLVASKLEAQLVVNSPVIDGSNAGDGATPPLNDTTAADGQLSPENDGTITIDHTDPPTDSTTDSSSQPSDSTQPANLEDATAITEPLPAQDSSASSGLSSGSKLMTEPPTLGGTLTGNFGQSDVDPVTDPLSLPKNDDNHLLEHDESIEIKAHDLAPLPSSDGPAQTATNPSFSAQVQAAPTVASAAPSWTPPPPPPPPTSVPSPPSLPPLPPPAATPPPPLSPPPPPPPSVPLPPPTATPVPDIPSADDAQKINSDETLADIEQAVASTHIQAETVSEARDEVKRAYNDSSTGADDPLPPIDALNAQRLGSELHPSGTTVDSTQSSATSDATPPPPVPPPIPFQFGSPPPTT